MRLRSPLMEDCYQCGCAAPAARPSCETTETPLHTRLRDTGSRPCSSTPAQRKLRTRCVAACVSTACTMGNGGKVGKEKGGTGITHLKKQSRVICELACVVNVRGRHVDGTHFDQISVGTERASQRACAATHIEHARAVPDADELEEWPGQLPAPSPHLKFVPCTIGRYKRRRRIVNHVVTSFNSSLQAVAAQRVLCAAEIHSRLPPATVSNAAMAAQRPRSLLCCFER